MADAPTPRIQVATPAEVPALAAVLSRASRATPWSPGRWWTPMTLGARIRRMFEIVDGMFAGRGWMHRTGDGAGVMVLIPPDGEAAARAMDASANAGMAALTPDGGERYARCWAWIDTTVPAEPHWLLDQVAVDPPAQGCGLGAAMLRFAIGRAEVDGLPLFLETGVAANVVLYERFGFTVMLHADAPGTGPHVWFMRRDPAR